MANIFLRVQVRDPIGQARRNIPIGVDEAKRWARFAVPAVAEFLEEAIRMNISFTGTSLKQLREMGHPYSRRADAPAPPTPEPWQVHIQGRLPQRSEGGPGTLIEALGIDEYEVGDQLGALVGIDDDIAEHVKHIVHGTRTMIPRPFLEQTLAEVEGQLFSIFGLRSGMKKIR